MTLIVKGDSAPLMADKVEQEARIWRLQELQDVLPILVRPLVRCDVWGLLRLYDGHEAGLFSSSSAAGVDSRLITLSDQWVSRRAVVAIQ